MNFSCKRVFTLILFLSVPLSLVSAQDLHVHKIKNVKQLHDFLKYRSGDRPIISGHRGGIVPGFPENSIAAFEHTLKQTPAFFEIDPRITKDSVLVLVHDATLARTCTGAGKFSDCTWEPFRPRMVREHLGHVTSDSMPALEAAIRWSKGKTTLDLDKTDVPF